MSKILYLGTDPSRYPRKVYHCPLIETKPLPLPADVELNWDQLTHILLTSPNAALILSSYKSLNGKKIIAIGHGTAQIVNAFAIAQPETQEGMIELLKTIDVSHAFILYPRSSKARPLLATYLLHAKIRHITCDLYETIYLKPNPLPDLSQFDEIIFTSPSTVHSFILNYHSIPPNKILTAIGPITERVLMELGKKELV